MEHIIFHVDVNSAYLSWEAVHRLTVLGEAVDLRNIPSAIGGSQKARRGIILAKSGPAKKYGVKTAETILDARRKCPNLVIVPPRHDLYAAYSKNFMEILTNYSPVMEKYSIDEAFLDMSQTCALFGSPDKAAETIKNKIKEELHFTVNIGISSNKLLAKMASDFKKPDLIHTLWPDEIQEKMWPLPVSELYFVGGATVKKLNNLGIHTIADLALSDGEMLRSHLGKHGTMIHAYANGTDSSPVTAVPGEIKGYSNALTIDHDVTSPKEARQILLSLCETVSSRLRSDHVKTAAVGVIIKNCFLSQGSHQRTLLSPTDVSLELYGHVCELFDEYWDGTPIRLLGVAAGKITHESHQQLDLFHMDQYTRQGELEKAVDDIRSKYGDHAIMRASFLHDKSHH